MIAALFSTLHVFGLALGLPGVFLRARALGRLAEDPSPERIPPVLAADNVWGVAALVWLVTGIGRAFAGLEKGTGYYMHSWLFIAKLALFVTVFALELWPMVTFIRWRSLLKAGKPVDVGHAATFARVSQLELALIVVIPFIASLIARGYGFGLRYPWE